MNRTNETIVLPFASVLGPVGYLALYCLTLAVICPVQLFLNALTLAAVLTSPVKKAQRAILVQITVIGLLTATTLAIHSISGIILTSGLHESGVHLCTFSAVVLHIALGMRTLMWATLTVVTYLFVRSGVKKVKVVPLTVASVAMWIFAAVTAIPYVTPAYNFDMLDGVICFTELTTAAIVHLAFSYTAGLSSHVVIISFVVATIMCVKRNTMNTDSGVPQNRAMVKFAALILTVSFITLGVNMLGFVPFAMGEAATLTIVVSFHLLSYNLLLSLPGIVTPLLMAAIFRPVRNSMKNILTCHYLTKKKEESSA